MTDDNLNAILDCLPQTQCGLCEHAGCRPYAEAIAAGRDDISQCAPGGRPVLERLAVLTGSDPTPFYDKVDQRLRQPSRARIREAECIGCTKCIQACPVDAIIGSGKRMHSILSAECTGCDLCIPACPVDCIEIEPLSAYSFDPAKALRRFDAKQQRLSGKVITQHEPKLAALGASNKTDLIAAALRRNKAKKESYDDAI